jgi:preprotein translocase subunit SecB
MTPEITPEQRAASDRVTAKASIFDIRLSHLQAELRTPGPPLPLSVSSPKVTPVMEAQVDPTVAVYHVTYDLGVEDRDGMQAMSASLTMSVIFDLAEHDFTNDDLAMFGGTAVLDIVHPYVREIFHSLTSRMGLAPLVLDIKTPYNSYS